MSEQADETLAIMQAHRNALNAPTRHRMLGTRTIQDALTECGRHRIIGDYVADLAAAWDRQHWFRRITADEKRALEADLFMAAWLAPAERDEGGRPPL